MSSEHHPNGKPSVTEASHLIAGEKRQRALKLRLAGYDFRAIAKALECSLGSAHKYIAEELEELRKETRADAEQLREIEIARLDKWERALQKGLKEPEGPNRAKVVSVLVKVAESRRKLLGLDAPQKIEHSGNLYSLKEASPDCAAWGEPAKEEKGPE